MMSFPNFPLVNIRCKSLAQIRPISVSVFVFQFLLPLDPVIIDAGSSNDMISLMCSLRSLRESIISMSLRLPKLIPQKMCQTACS